MNRVFEVAACDDAEQAVVMVDHRVEPLTASRTRRFADDRPRFLERHRRGERDDVAANDLTHEENFQRVDRVLARQVIFPRLAPVMAGGRLLRFSESIQLFLSTESVHESDGPSPEQEQARWFRNRCRRLL
jgi:hypothetical protein